MIKLDYEQTKELIHKNIVVPITKQWCNAHNQRHILLFAIPKSGYAVTSIILSEWADFFKITTNALEADFIIDDIIDSGATKEKYERQFGKKVYAIVDKTIDKSYEDKWVIFPFDKPIADNEETILYRLLQFFNKKINKDNINKIKDYVSTIT